MGISAGKHHEKDAPDLFPPSAFVTIIAIDPAFGASASPVTYDPTEVSWHDLQE